MKNKIAIGVDVGGSHVSCAAYDFLNQRLLTKSIVSIALNNQGSKEEVIDTFARILQSCMDSISEYELLGIGIAMPGPFDYTQGIGLFTGENAKFQCLNGVNLNTELQKKLQYPNLPIRFINDATAFAIGEYFSGQLKETKHSLAITLGTGLGSAFLSEGIPVIAEDSVPENGCIWHLPFERGIADDYFSTRGLINRFYDRTGIKAKGVKEIAELAKENKDAKEVFIDFGEKMGRFLNPWVKRFNVESIVFGGNISKASNLFHYALNEYFIGCDIQLKIKYSTLQESAAFVGGAQLLNEEFWQSVKTQLQYM